VPTYVLNSLHVFLRTNDTDLRMWSATHGGSGEVLWTLTVSYICHVNTTEIITALDAEIARLEHARSLIAGSGESKRRGRPAKTVPSAISTPKKRKLSPEARKKIAAAQKKRWAKQRTTKPVQITKVPAKKQPEKRLRAVKKGTAQNALSSRSETVAVAAKS
jgi:hypothetical protein